MRLCLRWYDVVQLRKHVHKRIPTALMTVELLPPQHENSIQQEHTTCPTSSSSITNCNCASASSIKPVHAARTDSMSKWTTNAPNCTVAESTGNCPSATQAQPSALIRPQRGPTHIVPHRSLNKAPSGCIQYDHSCTVLCSTHVSQAHSTTAVAGAARIQQTRHILKCVVHTRCAITAAGCQLASCNK